MLDETEEEGHEEKKEIVALNVGGKEFRTNRDTLLSIPNSVLSSLAACRDQPPDAPIFLDRDPTTFHLVLNYLRDKDRVVLPDTKMQLMQLLAEANYFCLRVLAALVEKRLEEMRQDDLQKRQNDIEKRQGHLEKRQDDLKKQQDDLEKRHFLPCRACRRVLHVPTFAGLECTSTGPKRRHRGKVTSRPDNTLFWDCCGFEGPCGYGLHEF